MKTQLSILSIYLFTLISFVSCSQPHPKDQAVQTSKEMAMLTANLAKGWNTWNTRSVMSYVLLPQAFCVNLQLEDKSSGSVLREALIGRRGTEIEKVTPGPHAYDGSYSELTVEWKGMVVKVQSATVLNQFILIVTPVKADKNQYLRIKPEVLWGHNGRVQTQLSGFTFKNDSLNHELYITASSKPEVNDSLITCALIEPICVSTSENMSIGDAQKIILKAASQHSAQKRTYGADSSLYDAMQTVLAWDIIYETTQNRVIAPVSRIWNCNWNGWVLFDWDTYFASYMFSLDNKELAYANAIAITKEITKNGFIPNFGSGLGRSEDRSEPPVGSFIVWKIYQKYHEKWFLHEVFNELLSWNRWWAKSRDVRGYLCWGSDPYDISGIPKWLGQEVGKKQAGMWESGLDNSPMFDDAVFDTTKHRLMLADVGLLSMYIWDCKYLSMISKELGNENVQVELDKRAAHYSKSLESLWGDKTGMYLNKDLVTGHLSQRLSPTNFYPLLAGVPSQKKAERMIQEHFYNPQEFWGEWIMPSIARNDKAFSDNTYWRGRIWAPMNLLVYCGVTNYDLLQARQDLVKKSANLLLKSWNEERHVYENYNSISGVGDDVVNSDKFYHWGGLLAFITLLEHQNTTPVEKSEK